MYNLLTKKGQLFAFLLGVIATAITLFSIIGNSNKYMLDSPDAAKNSVEIANTGILNTGLNITMLLLIIATAAVVIFGLIQLASNIKGSLKFIIGFAVMIAMFFILKGTAVHETTGSIVEKFAEFDISENLSKTITSAIKGTMALGIFAVAAMVISEILNIFK